MDQLLCPTPGMELWESARFKPGIYRFTGEEGFIVRGDHIHLDFTGVVIEGGSCSGVSLTSKARQEEFSYGEEPKDEEEQRRVEALGYSGMAIRLINVKNVTIRGLTAKGFNLALEVVGCEGITVENCNFSDNFHDPECGWQEHGPLGGILLERSHGCVIRNNRANNVWNGVCLRFANRNLVIGNDFSHASNMCVKMWNACENRVEGNNLSWGLRIRPGEVHARDSAGLLMESGSCRNVVRGNDLTHGGDGLFVRVLNGWHSSGNVFEDNDCSFANNNAIEAWAEGNTYIRNKANRSSYGFWLGGSDHTVLYENEACENGIFFQNAPEAFGNCGIAVVNGSGHDFRLIGNRINDNRGPGLAVRFKKEYPIEHWVVEKNEICRNRSSDQFAGHGVFLENAGFLSFAGNRIEDNDGEGIFHGEGLAYGITMLPGHGEPLKVHATLQTILTVGEASRFACLPVPEGETLRWIFGDETESFGESVDKSYERPGSYFVCVHRSNGERSAFDGGAVYVLPKGEPLHVRNAAAAEDWEGSLHLNEDDTVSFRSSIEKPCREHLLELSFFPSVPASEAESVAMLLFAESDSQTDWDRTLTSPVVTFFEDAQNYWRVTPKAFTADALFTERTWEKTGYRYYELPLAGNGDYEVERVGAPSFIARVQCRLRYRNPGILQGVLGKLRVYRR